MLKVAACSLLFLVADQAFAHTVELGRAVVPGACASLETTTDSKWLIYRQENNRVRYGDGFVEVRAIVVPDMPLPNQRPDDLMSRCTRDIYQGQMSNRSTSGEQLPEEDVYLRGINRCLEANGASYRAQYVVIRRSEVRCPQTPTNQ